MNAQSFRGPVKEYLTTGELLQKGHRHPGHPANDGGPELARLARAVAAKRRIYATSSSTCCPTTTSEGRSSNLAATRWYSALDRASENDAAWRSISRTQQRKPASMLQLHYADQKNEERHRGPQPWCSPRDQCADQVRQAPEVQCKAQTEKGRSRSPNRTARSRSRSPRQRASGQHVRALSPYAQRKRAAPMSCTHCRTTTHNTQDCFFLTNKKPFKPPQFRKTFEQPRREPAFNGVCNSCNNVWPHVPQLQNTPPLGEQRSHICMGCGCGFEFRNALLRHLVRAHDRLDQKELEGELEQLWRLDSEVLARCKAVLTQMVAPKQHYEGQARRPMIDQINLFSMLAGRDVGDWKDSNYELSELDLQQLLEDARAQKMEDELEAQATIWIQQEATPTLDQSSRRATRQAELTLLAHQHQMPNAMNDGRDTTHLVPMPVARVLTIPTGWDLGVQVSRVDTLVDTGCNVSAIDLTTLANIRTTSGNQLQAKQQSDPLVLRTASQGSLTSLGEINLKFQLGDVVVSHRFQVFDKLPYRVILGMDFIMEKVLSFDPTTAVVQTRQPNAWTFANTANGELTEQCVAMILPADVTLHQGACMWLSIPNAKLDPDMRYGIVTADLGDNLPLGILLSHGLVDASAGNLDVRCMAMNFSQHSVTIDKGTLLGWWLPIQNDQVERAEKLDDRVECIRQGLKDDLTHIVGTKMGLPRTSRTNRVAQINAMDLRAILDDEEHLSAPVHDVRRSAPDPAASASKQDLIRAANHVYAALAKGNLAKHPRRQKTLTAKAMKLMDRIMLISGSEGRVASNVLPDNMHFERRLQASVVVGR